MAHFEENSSEDEDLELRLLIATQSDELQDQHPEEDLVSPVELRS